MIAVVDVKIQAENPAMPLWPMRAYVGSPSSIRVRNVPKKIGDWCINKVTFVVNYPDNTTQSVECKLVGGVYVGTVEGSTRSGNVSEGYSIIADGVDESGSGVAGYVLGKGNVEILANDTNIDPDEPNYTVHLLSGESESPKTGDMWLSGEAINIVDTDGTTKTFEQPELSGYATKDELSAKQDKISANGILSCDSNGNVTSADMSQFVKNGGAVINGLTALGTNYIDGYASLYDLSNALSSKASKDDIMWSLEEASYTMDENWLVYKANPHTVNRVQVDDNQYIHIDFDITPIPGKSFQIIVLVDCNVTIPVEFEWDGRFAYYGTTDLENGGLNVFTFTQIYDLSFMVRREVY